MEMRDTNLRTKRLILSSKYQVKESWRLNEAYLHVLSNTVVSLLWLKKLLSLSRFFLETFGDI